LGPKKKVPPQRKGGGNSPKWSFVKAWGGGGMWHWGGPQKKRLVNKSVVELKKGSAFSLRQKRQRGRGILKRKDASNLGKTLQGRRIRTGGGGEEKKGQLA